MNKKIFWYSHHALTCKQESALKGIYGDDCKIVKYLENCIGAQEIDEASALIRASKDCDIIAVQRLPFLESLVNLAKGTKKILLANGKYEETDNLYYNFDTGKMEKKVEYVFYYWEEVEKYEVVCRAIEVQPPSKKTVFWLSRHQMSDQQLYNLKRYYGEDITIEWKPIKVSSTEDIIDAARDADVLAVILTIEIISDLLKNAALNKRPVLRAIPKRVLAEDEVETSDASIDRPEYKVCPSDWEEVVSVDIKTKILASKGVD